MSEVRPGPAELALDDVGGVEPLQVLHAPQQPLLQVHHLVGVLEVARQLGVCAFELAGTFAEVAHSQG